MSAPSAHPNRRRSPSLPVFPHVPVSSTYSSSFATLARRQLSLARGKVYEVRKRGSSGQRKSEKWTPCLSESLQIYISVYLDSSLSCIFLLLSLNLPCWWLLSSSSLCGCWPSLRLWPSLCPSMRYLVEPPLTYIHALALHLSTYPGSAV